MSGTVVLFWGGWLLGLMAGLWLAWRKHTGLAITAVSCFAGTLLVGANFGRLWGARFSMLGIRVVINEYELIFFLIALYILGWILVISEYLRRRLTA